MALAFALRVSLIAFSVTTLDRLLGNRAFEETIQSALLAGGIYWGIGLFWGNWPGG